MKIEIKVELDDFIERWGDDSLETFLDDEIKKEILKAIRVSDKYQKMIERNVEKILKKI